MKVPEEFSEIRPYEPEEMKQAFEDLLSDRQFNVIMKGFAPWLPKSVRNGLLRLAFTGVKTPLDFHKTFDHACSHFLLMVFSETQYTTCDVLCYSTKPEGERLWTHVMCARKPRSGCRF